MKTKIKSWIESYFYFNKLEQQGIFLLLFFILLSFLFKISLPFFWKPAALQVTFIQAEIPHQEKKKPIPQQSFFITSDSTQFTKPKKKIPQTLNLNTADSLDILALYKIGPGLTSKIIQYRKKLGGFVSLQQLTEIYGFQEDLLYDLEGKLWIEPADVKKMNLNTVGFDELKTHPYFKFTLSKQILNYRQVHGLFKQIEDLKNIKSVNDSIFNLIKPYVFVD
ncbi:MAG: ComEA family DNA-binding protein [Bacteroidia bacterium]